MNDNIKNVQISGIRKFYNEVQKVENAISLTLGQPDFELPKAIKEGLIKAIDENKTTYTSNAGIIELRDEISKYLRTKDISYESNEICITVGGSEALFNIFTALINKDDKVLIPTPAYPAYESIVTMLGGKVVNYSLDDEFKINVSDIEDKIKTMNIKYLVLSLPSNPTGAILSKEEKEKFINIIRANDINGLSGKVATAIANAIGEFLASVVKFNAIESSLFKFIPLDTNIPTIKLITKNNNTGTSNCNRTSGC